MLVARFFFGFEGTDSSMSWLLFRVLGWLTYPGLRARVFTGSSEGSKETDSSTSLMLVARFFSGFEGTDSSRSWLMF